MIIGKTPVGGTLTLTNKRLTFEPNSINQLFRPSMRDMLWELQLDQIKEVLPTDILGMPLGIKIESKWGESFTLNVWGRDNWINLINQNL
jgi:hypothetical protein